MSKNNDIQEMFFTTVSLLPITSDTKEVDELVKRAIGCIKILKDAGEINSFITTNYNNPDLKKTPLDVVFTFNFHNKKSINNPQLLKLAEYIKQAGGKREGDDVLKRTNDRMKIATEKLDVYEKIFFNLSKEVKNLQKDSSSYVSELEKLFSTIEEKKESLESLYIDWVKENDQDLKFLIFERKLYTVELHPLMNNMLYIKDIQEIIQGDLTDLKSYVEKLKKECSENQISSSLTHTIIEPQQQYCAIM